MRFLYISASSVQIFAQSTQKMSPCVIIESDSAYNLFPVFAKASRLTLDGFLIFFPSIFLQKQPNPALDDRRDILRGFIAVKIRGRFLGNNL